MRHCQCAFERGWLVVLVVVVVVLLLLLLLLLLPKTLQPR